MFDIDISIITVGYSSQKTLPALLNSIKKQEGCKFEFIYVENNAANPSCEIVKEHIPSAIIIEPKANLGFSKGCNLGYTVAKGRYLLFRHAQREPIFKITTKKPFYSNFT